MTLMNRNKHHFSAPSSFFFWNERNASIFNALKLDCQKDLPDMRPEISHFYNLLYLFVLISLPSSSCTKFMFNLASMSKLSFSDQNIAWIPTEIMILFTMTLYFLLLLNYISNNMNSQLSLTPFTKLLTFFSNSVQWQFLYSIGT